MSTFVDSFDDSGVPDELDSHGHFGSNTIHDDAAGSYVGYNSDRFDTFVPNNDVFISDPVPIYGAGNDFAPAEDNGSFDGELDESNGPVLPPPSQMEEVGFALREWRRENTLRLEEKEKKERELLSKIIEEAEDYKIEFHKKREVTCESNKAINRETEKVSFDFAADLVRTWNVVFVAKKEKFHAEADKDYWKSIAELIPNEVPAIERKRKAKKDQENKPSIMVVQGPKPGKPTELSRMRHILVQLKHNTPQHLKLAPPAPAKDPKAGATTSASAEGAASTSMEGAVPKAPEPVAVA
ncbi:Clathrin light chain 2 [Linum perenne]